MKILRVISSMDPASGGPCQGIRNLTPALRELGVEAEVVCLDAPDAPFLQDGGIRIYALGSGKGAWHLNALLRPWLEEHASEYDAVILHGLWLYQGFAVWQWAKRRGTAPPYFVYPHGMLDPWFQESPERKWKAVRNRIYWKWIESRVVRGAAGLLFTCAEERRLAGLTFNDYHPQRELNVGYGVPEPLADTPERRAAFLAACPGLATGRPYLLFLSRIHSKKGLDLLVKAYAGLYKEAGGTGLENFPALVIAGPGADSAYGQEVRALVQAHGPADSVFWPGMLQGDAKWGAFHGCEAYVLPSHQENFGIAVVEALACRKPVLISRKVNICQEIEADGAGWVGEDTLEGTLELLRRWWQARGGEGQGERARQCYERHFGVGPAAAALRDALARVLEESSNRK